MKLWDSTILGGFIFSCCILRSLVYIYECGEGVGLGVMGTLGRVSL